MSQEDGVSDVQDRPDVVIVGGGAAGHAAAETLRREGFGGRVALVHGETGPAYRRTMVNKALLQGLLTVEQATLPAVEDVEVVHGRAASLNPARSALVLRDGRELDAAALVVATGAAPRPSPHVREAVPHQGEVLRGREPGPGRRVVHLHTAPDAVWLRALLGADLADRTVTVLGAGFIGAETAAWFAESGATVHLVARSALPLAGSLGSAVAGAVAHLHQDHLGTHFGRRVEAVREHPGAVSVWLDDATVLESDVVLVAHGTVPDASWVSTGSGGVVVDDRLAVVAAPGRYAAGSVALHPGVRGLPYRTDHWDAAAAQGVHVARTVLRDLVGGADPGPYVPGTGFSMSLYRTQVAGFGVRVPGAVEEHHRLEAGGVLTTFRTPGGDLIAIAGIGAARELYALRQDLRQP